MCVQGLPGKFRKQFQQFESIAVSKTRFYFSFETVAVTTDQVYDDEGVLNLIGPVQEP